MATKVLTPSKGEVNQITAFTPEVAQSAADGLEFVMPKVTEEYVVVVVHNTGSSAADVTLKKPESGSYAAAGSDESISLEAGAYAQIRIESARFADNKGKVKLGVTSTSVKVAVLY